MTPDPVPAPSPSWRDLMVVNTRRAFLLMAAGGVIGLALAGVSLFTAKGTSTLIVPPDAVATVNQQPISRIDFEGQLRSLGVDPGKATPAERHGVLEDMIREELFVQRAKELDLAVVDPDIRAAMVKGVEAQAAADAITAQPTEAALRDYYDHHRERYASEGTLVVRDLVFPVGRGTTARAALAAHAPVEDVLRRTGGRDTGKTQGEEFYFAARIHLGEVLFGAARALDAGAVSQVIAQPDGDHVLLVVSNQRPRPYGFEAARAQVATDRQADAVVKAQAGDARFLRKRANILVAKDLR